jgi:hypothetical protein
MEEERVPFLRSYGDCRGVDGRIAGKQKGPLWASMTMLELITRKFTDQTDGGILFISRDSTFSIYDSRAIKQQRATAAW